MTYPLFDGNFTVWLGDVETLIKTRTGKDLKEYSVSRNTLAEYFYKNRSAFSTVCDIEMQVILNKNIAKSEDDQLR
jgi:hypothetical protein